MVPHPAVQANLLFKSPANKEKEPSIRTTYSLDQSLNFIVASLRFMGCPVDLPGIRSEPNRYLTLGFALILLTSNLSLNFFVLISSLLSITSQSSMSVADWIYIITEVDFTFYFATIHIASLVRVAPNFKRILAILQRIDRLGILQAEDYKKFRFVSIAMGSTFSLLVIYAYVNF